MLTPEDQSLIVSFEESDLGQFQMAYDSLMLENAVDEGELLVVYDGIAILHETTIEPFDSLRLRAPFLARDDVTFDALMELANKFNNLPSVYKAHVYRDDDERNWVCLDTFIDVHLYLYPEQLLRQLRVFRHRIYEFKGVLA